MTTLSSLGLPYNHFRSSDKTSYSNNDNNNDDDDNNRRNIY